MNRNLDYRIYISEGLLKIDNSRDLFGTKLSKAEIILKLLKDTEIFDFYNIKELLEDYSFRRNFITNLNLKDVTEILEILDSKGYTEEPIFEDLVDSYRSLIQYYVYDLDFIDYIDAEDCEGVAIASNNEEYEKAMEELEEHITDQLIEEIMSLVFDLNNDEILDYAIDCIREILTDQIEAVVKWHIEPEPDDDYPDPREDKFIGDYTLDIILDRDIY